MGDAATAACSVLKSEPEVDAIQLDDEPEWARFMYAAYLSGEYANAFRDLNRPAETARFATLSAAEASRKSRARRGSLAHATLARSAPTNRDLEAAAAEASTTVRFAVPVKSRRSTDAVHDLRNRMTEHKASPAVNEFFELADALVPQRAGGEG